MLDITREELRSEIRTNVLEIVTAVVNESSRNLRRMLSEDIVAVSDHVDRLEKRMTKGFKAVDKRFKEVDKRFKQVDARFEQIDRHFEKIEQDVHHTNVQLQQTNHLLKSHVADPTAHTRLAPA